MKMLVWAILGTAVAGVAFWIAWNCDTVPASPLLLLALALIDGAGAIGAFWMMYQVIRYERRPFPFILLAFIPYFFLGYYFERVRGRTSRPVLGG